MLTIKGRTPSDRIIVPKDSIKSLLDNTHLSYLCDINDLCPDSIITFEEILVRAKVFDADIATDSIALSEMMNVFKQFLNKKTVLQSNKTYGIGMIDTSVENVPSCSVIDKLRLTIIPSLIPKIISDLNLESVYEQLIVYEYIYMSECHTLHKKLDIIVENNYETLLSFLEDCSLEICTTSAELESTDTNIDTNKSKFEMIKLRHRYYDADRTDNGNRVAMFNRFIDLHTNWMSYDVKDLDRIDDRSIRIAEMVDHSIIPNDSTSSMCFSLTCLSIDEFSHLNIQYQRNPESTIAVLKVLLPLLDVGSFVNVRDDEGFIRMYNSLDLMMRLFEDDNDLISLIPIRTQQKIVSLWLKMSSPTYKCFRYCRKYPNPYSLRTITLSKSIEHIISNMCVTFDEMGYILATDNLVMFQIMCKNMEFKIIHPAFYRYLSPKILSWIIDRSIEINNTPKLKMIPKFSINMYDLINRSNDQITHVLNTLHDSFESEKEPVIELVSINNRYEYVDCIYAVMYWDYLLMLINNPECVMNIVLVLTSVSKSNIKTNLSNYYLDVVILMTVLDNIDSHIIDLCNIKTSLNKLTEHMFKDDDMMMLGPDFTEIIEELKRIGVTNTEYLLSLKNVQDESGFTRYDTNNDDDDESKSIE